MKSQRKLYRPESGHRHFTWRGLALASERPTPLGRDHTTWTSPRPNGVGRSFGMVGSTWKRRAAPFCISLCLLSLIAVGCQSAPPNSLATHNSARWEKEISAFEAKDKANPPLAHCIVLVGSSSIRIWTNLPAAFPGLPVVNRGFGGSQLADSVNFADRIVIPYRPRQVVIYAGGNDINAGKSPDLVYGDFVALVTKIRTRLRHARIAYISSAPNPSRWAQVEKVKRLNALVAAYCQRHGIDFINVFPLMLGSDGLPKRDIFLPDRLHMNAKGYAIWKEAVRPYLH